MKDAAVIGRADDWLTARVGDEIMMMSATHGHYVGMNEVGARIWELIEHPIDVGALCGKLADEFDVAPERCRSDVEAFLDEMEKHGAVAVDRA